MRSAVCLAALLVSACAAEHERAEPELPELLVYQPLAAHRALTTMQDFGPAEPVTTRNLDLGWYYNEPGYLSDGIALGQMSDAAGYELVVLMEGTGDYCGAPHVAPGRATVLSSDGNGIGSFAAAPGNDVMGLSMAMDLDGDDSMEYLFCETGYEGVCRAMSGDSTAQAWATDPAFCAGSWNMGPSAGDVVGTPAHDGDEVVIVDWMGDVRVLERATGALIASYDTYETLGEWPNGHAAIADVDATPGNEIVIAGGDAGRVIALAADGATPDLQVVYTSDPLPGGGYLDGSGPAIADLDGDGEPEIVVAATGAPAIYAFSVSHGTQCKYKWTTTSGADYYWTSPVIGDVDGDGHPEVVVLSIDAVMSVLAAPTATPGNCADGVVEWEHTIAGGESAWFTPALGQLAGGNAIDVVVASNTTLEIVDVQAAMVAYRFVDPAAQFYPTAVIAPGPSAPGAPAAHVFASDWYSGGVYRLDTASTSPTPQPWTGSMGSNARTGAP